MFKHGALQVLEIGENTRDVVNQVRKIIKIFKIFVHPKNCDGPSCLPLYLIISDCPKDQDRGFLKIR